MYKEMRRGDRALDESESMIILQNGEYGVLSTVGGDGQPYATPLSYVICDNHICFHCALTGQKVDNLATESRTCFSVVGQTQPVYDGNYNYSTYFESVIVYGSAERVEAGDEKTRILLALVKKYFPDNMNAASDAIRNSLPNTAVYKISIEHMTGKAKRRK